jgi:transcriptional regulator with XRE-family HTH domain
VTRGIPVNAAALRRELKARNWTASDLARASQRGRPAIWHGLHGLAVDGATLDAWAAAFGTDVSPTTPTCRCGTELAPDWRFCPTCARSTSPPAPPSPSRSELLRAEMRRLDAARPGPPPPNVEQLLVAAVVKVGKKALAEVADLEATDFADEGLGYTLNGLRRLAESGGRWDAT